MGIAEINEGRGVRVISPVEICKMGKKLGVINENNESRILKRIKDLEGLVDSAKEAQQNQVN